MHRIWHDQRNLGKPATTRGKGLGQSPQAQMKIAPHLQRLGQPHQQDTSVVRGNCDAKALLSRVKCRLFRFARDWGLRFVKGLIIALFYATVAVDLIDFGFHLRDCLSFGSAARIVLMHDASILFSGLSRTGRTHSARLRRNLSYFACRSCCSTQ